MKTTLVIGATGRVGRGIVAALAARGERVRAATRHPEWATGLNPESVEAVAFDYDRPETFAAALTGVDRLFLIVRPGDGACDTTAIPLVDAAVERGVGHVVTLTALGVDRMPENALRRVERHVEDTAPSWAHLRPNFFMQIFSAAPLLDQIREADVLKLPAGDARLSFIDARDIAAAAVIVLLESSWSGRGYSLTGAEAIDHDTVAHEIGAATGRPVRYEALDEDEARREMARGGLSKSRVERLVGFYRLVRAGACASVSGDLPALIGRPATSFGQFARDHADTWTSVICVDRD